MTGPDPHSFSDPAQGKVVHLDWQFTVDFSAEKLHGTATLTTDEARAGRLTLDTRDLQIEAVRDEAGQPLAFSLGEPDEILGTPLFIERTSPTAKVTIDYTTGADASALMWLSPSQTSGTSPFLLTQCQAIHARSIVPITDSPGLRFTYEARVTVPEGLHAVMSAAPGVREAGELVFSMPQPIPAYLLALAVGDLQSADLGPRTRVWAEPSVLEAAAYEFAEAESMLTSAEALFGPYRWERYDFVVLPPSFPMGGMENPRMTFLTPTLLAGDRSLVSVLAHELAHSWTGNLVTNATNEHFWLNEGWTVYAERRILETLYGTEAAHADAVLGRNALDATMSERAAAGQRNALTYDQAGLDPDGEFSKLPYEKGFLLVTALEREVGREVFDPFVHAYIEHFAMRPITTDDFVAFVEDQLDVSIDWDLWLHGDVLPDDAPTFRAPRLEELSEAAKAGKEADPQGVTEILHYLSQLPTPTPEACIALGERLALPSTANAELQSAWLALAVRSGVAHLEEPLTDFLDTMGRTKLLRPVVRAMRQSSYAKLAAERLSANRSRWHSSTRVALGI